MALLKDVCPSGGAVVFKVSQSQAVPVSLSALLLCNKMEDLSYCFSIMSACLLLCSAL